MQAGEDAGVVHHDVQAAEAADRGVDEGLDGGVVAGVGLDVPGRANVLPDQVVGGDIGVGVVAALAGFTVNVGADDGCALSGLRQRDRAAVSRARARDHGDRVLQATHLSSFRPAGGNEGSHPHGDRPAPPRRGRPTATAAGDLTSPGPLATTRFRSGRLIPEHPPGHAHFHRTSADHRSRNSCDPPSYRNGQNGPRHRRCPGRRHARIPLRCHPGPTASPPPVRPRAGSARPHVVRRR